MGVMGGHFTDVFEKDDWFQWRMVPFIVIWVLFAIVVVVRS
jgi:hypothetical protein